MARTRCTCDGCNHDDPGAPNLGRERSADDSDSASLYGYAHRHFYIYPNHNANDNHDADRQLNPWPGHPQRHFSTTQRNPALTAGHNIAGHARAGDTPGPQRDCPDFEFHTGGHNLYPRKSDNNKYTGNNCDSSRFDFRLAIRHSRGRFHFQGISYASTAGRNTRCTGLVLDPNFIDFGWAHLYLFPFQGPEAKIGKKLMQMTQPHMEPR
jgi:hypothetical protein